MADSPDLIALIALMRSVTGRKLALRHDIGYLGILKNYQKSPVLKYEQEVKQESRVTSHKIHEIQKIKLAFQRNQSAERKRSKLLNTRQECRSVIFPYKLEQNPEDLMLESSSKLEKLREHLQNLNRYLIDLLSQFNENSKKIEENNQRAVYLAKYHNEIKDLRHCKSLLFSSKHFLDYKRMVLIKNNALKEKNTLSKNYLLEKNKALLNEHVFKLELLKKRTDEKHKSLIEEHEKIMSHLKETNEDLSNHSELKIKLEKMLKVEEEEKDKVKYWSNILQDLKKNIISDKKKTVLRKKTKDSLGPEKIDSQIMSLQRSLTSGFQPRDQLNY